MTKKLASQDRSQLIKIAKELEPGSPERRAILSGLTKVSMEFPSKDAFDAYMKDHPNADPKNHSVKKEEKGAPAKKPGGGKLPAAAVAKVFNDDSKKIELSGPQHGDNEASLDDDGSLLLHMPQDGGKSIVLKTNKTFKNKAEAKKFLDSTDYSDADSKEWSKVFSGKTPPPDAKKTKEREEKFKADKSQKKQQKAESFKKDPASFLDESIGKFPGVKSFSAKGKGTWEAPMSGHKDFDAVRIVQKGDKLQFQVKPKGEKDFLKHTNEGWDSKPEDMGHDALEVMSAQYGRGAKENFEKA